jgi:hypothetical protein
MLLKSYANAKFALLRPLALASGREAWWFQGNCRTGGETIWLLLQTSHCQIHPKPKLDSLKRLSNEWGFLGIVN